MITGRPAHSSAMPVLFLLSGPKWVFRPAGATRCPDKRDIWHRSSMSNFTFIGAKMWEYSPQNCQNFEFWPEICTSGSTRLQYFYEILSVCTSLQVDFNFLVWSLSTDKHPSYKQFPAVGAFSHKFSIAPSGETIGSKKVSGVQKRDGPPLSPCQVW